MAEVTTGQKSPTSGAQLGVVRLAGRIDSSRSKAGARGKLFFTVLKLPAPDSYTSPATVEVISEERLGASGDEVSIMVRVGGYSRSFADKEGGQVRTADNTLSFLQFA